MYIFLVFWKYICLFFLIFIVEKINLFVFVALKYHRIMLQVFWNPRLGHEHERIVNLVDKNDVVHDMFAGIGPFAIPLAKKGDISRYFYVY